MNFKKSNEQTNIKLFDNKRANNYENRKMEYNFNTVPFEWHISIALKLIKNDLKIVDIGCGTGELIRALALEKKNEFMGVDLSKSMIKVAKNNSKSFENLSFDTMSATDLKIEDKTFDIALTRGALHHFPNPLKAIQEIYRTLKDEGELHILDILSYEDSEVDELFNKTNVLRQPANFKFYSKSKLDEFCNEAGFKKNKIYKHKITIELDKWLKTYNEYEKVKNLFLNSSNNIKSAFNIREERGVFLIDFISFYLIASK